MLYLILRKCKCQDDENPHNQLQVSDYLAQQTKYMIRINRIQIISRHRLAQNTIHSLLFIRIKIRFHSCSISLRFSTCRASLLTNCVLILWPLLKRTDTVEPRQVFWLASVFRSKENNLIIATRTNRFYSCAKMAPSGLFEDMNAVCSFLNFC